MPHSIPFCAIERGHDAVCTTPRRFSVTDARPIQKTDERRHAHPSKTTKGQPWFRGCGAGKDVASYPTVQINLFHHGSKKEFYRSFLTMYSTMSRMRIRSTIAARRMDKASPPQCRCRKKYITAAMTSRAIRKRTMGQLLPLWGIIGALITASP